MSYFAGRVALVTGSSGGVGAATAVLLAQQGCNVAITGRKADKLKVVEDQCRKAGVKVSTTLGDVANVDHLKAMVAKTEQELGPIDILVNNAGFMPSADLSLSTGTIENYDATMNVNMRSVMILTKLCLPSLKKTKGCVVNISSVGSVKCTPNFMFYALSKASVDYFTKAAAIELAPFKIRVNGINPGGVRTGFADAALGTSLTKEQSDQMWDSMGATHPLGRCAEPIEIAQAVAYLAGEHAGFITGTSLFVDGGYAHGSAMPNATEALKAQDAAKK